MTDRSGKGPIDILLLDIGVPGRRLEAGRRIALEYPAVKIIHLTGSNREAYATEANAAGARGYVLKGATGSGHLGQELSARMMRRSDFRDDAYRTDVHGKHTATDRPCLASVACGPLLPGAHGALADAIGGQADEETTFVS